MWERRRVRETARQMGVQSEESAETVQAGKFAVSRDCGGNEWIQKIFSVEAFRPQNMYAYVWLTQFAEELHSQRSVDEEEQHEEEAEISHLEARHMLDKSVIFQRNYNDSIIYSTGVHQIFLFVLNLQWIPFI